MLEAVQEAVQEATREATREAATAEKATSANCRPPSPRGFVLQRSSREICSYTRDLRARCSTAAARCRARAYSPSSA